MFSLRSISMFAVVTCATLSSAAPLEAANEVFSSLHNPRGVTLPPRQLDLGSYDSSLLKRDTQSIPHIYNTCYGTIQPVVVKLNAAVDVSVESVDKAYVVVLLNLIVGALNVAIHDIKVLVAAKLSLDVLLTLNGVLLTVAELAVIVCGLLRIVVDVLVVVVKVVGVADVTVGPVLIVISGLIVNLLSLTFSLVVELKASLLIVVEPLAVDLAILVFDNVSACLGI